MPKRTKKPVTKTATKTLEIPITAMTQNDESLRQEQLLDAYRERDGFQQQLFGIKSRVSNLRASLAMIHQEQAVAEQLLRHLSDTKGASELWDMKTVSHYLICFLGQNKERHEEVQKEWAEFGTKTRELQAKLSKVNHEIRLLFERGPNPQQKFDMEEEE